MAYLSVKCVRFLILIYFFGEKNMSLKDMTGQKVPSVTFHTRQGDAWVDVTTDEIFNNKKVVDFLITRCFHTNLFINSLTTLQRN